MMLLQNYLFHIACRKDIAYLLIERFDRIILKNTVTRVHQEDFCQALSVSSTKKYQNEGGPSFVNCFDLLTNTTQPAIDRNALASAMVFNFLIGNCDAHGKNFSLLHHHSGELSLSPLYDLVSTTFYPTLSTTMAMKIGDKYKMNDIDLTRWEKLCRQIQYNFPYLKRLIEQHCHAILNALEKNNDFYTDTTKNPAFVDGFTKKLRANITRTLKNIQYQRVNKPLLTDCIDPPYSG